MNSSFERVAGELHAKLGELSSDVSKGRGEACGARPGFETTRRAKLAARTASGRAGLAAVGDLAAAGNRATAGDLAATQSDRHDQTDAIRQKSGGPQENLGTTTHAFTDVN